MRPILCAALAGAAAAGCGGDDPEPRSERPPRTPAAATATADPNQVPPDGYTCGELRSREYRSRQADAILDERGIDGARRKALKRRLMRALFVACDPGPDYRRAADDVARDVLGPG
jgi:hypothetical protein